jgi:hypothetical protein
LNRHANFVFRRTRFLPSAGVRDVHHIGKIELICPTQQNYSLREKQQLSTSPPREREALVAGGASLEGWLTEVFAAHPSRRAHLRMTLCRGERAVIARSACDEAIQFFLFLGFWIASWSLSSGAHSHDPSIVTPPSP